MKDYLDYKNGEIVDNQNSSYIDQIEENNVEEITEDKINNDEIKNYNSKKNLDMYKEEKLLKEYENILQPSKKDFLEDYEYTDDTQIKKKEKKTVDKKKNIRPKKEKKKKHWFVSFFNVFLRFISFLLRIIFLLLLFFSFMFFVMLGDYKNEQLNKTEEKDDIEQVIEDVKENNISNNIDNNDIYFTYKQSIQKYIDDCTQIINGELLIIENLKDNLITEQDVYNYFYITLSQKSKLINNFSLEKYPTELKSVTNYCKQILISAETNSKVMINHYILGNKSVKMINDMDTFFSKYIEQLTELNKYFNSLN